MGKNMLNEIDEYLKRNNSWNGNDLLYLFCKKNPFPNKEVIERQKRTLQDPKNLTSAESIFANQMWLIGRAYAASPERYSYTLRKDNQKRYKDHHPGKPGESFLGTEGYESFFQDIAQILFRSECSEGSTTFFRGESKNLGDEMDGLENAAELIKILNAKAEAENVKLSDVSLRHEALTDDIKEMNKIVKEAREQLRFFHEDLRDEDGFLAKLKSLSDDADRIIFEQQPKNDTKSKTDTDFISGLTACVIHFAKALNAARVLRDATVTVLTIRRLQKRVSSSKEDLKKCELKQWAAFSKGAKLLVEGAPSVNVSFSSKLLHFYYPKAFFIYDSISASRAPKLSTTFEGFSEPAHLEANATTGVDSSTYEQKLSEKEKGKFEDYYKHAVHELAFSRYIVKRLGDANCPEYANLLRQLKNIEPQPVEANPFSHCLTITRLVDDLVMNGGTAHQGEDNEQAGS